VPAINLYFNPDYKYWDKIGRDEILKSLEANQNINTNLAKNVIIFVGDGMSLPTLTATRIYQAQLNARQQKKKVNGEESLLFFETFPHVGLSKVGRCHTTQHNYIMLNVIMLMAAFLLLC
jgi:hypothetical protein